MPKSNHTITITVLDKVATAQGSEKIVCGNSDYVAVFAFDDEWAAQDVKTARFITQGGHYTDVVFSGSECPIPALYNTRACKIGVYAGDLMTTTPAYIDCDNSILCGGGTPADPQPDVYAQLMEKIDSGMLQGPQGPKGDTGEKGDPGEKGEKGVAGPTGPQGDPGEKGEKGDTGATGPAGPTGATGPQGEKGATGAAGHSPTVTATKSGKVTTIKVDGAAIATINDGTDGTNGKDGATGPQGPTGATGPQGEKGATGAAGHSPTVTATKSGKVTTIKVDGTAIATINDGTDGTNGKDGATGPQGEKGATGATGPQGEKGATGAAGHSPTVTATKSGKVTTIKVDGTAIATINDGTDGTNGKDGATGPQGEKGATGATGPQGEKGATGAAGHSPTVTATKSGKVTTIKVDGTAIATINDGTDGTNGKDGATGPQGPKGDPGSDASVTAANVKAALGYTPAKPGDVPTAQITANTNARHSHSNKAVLDEITGLVTADNVFSPDNLTDLVQYSAFQIAAQHIIDQIPTTDSIVSATLAALPKWTGGSY